MNEVSTSGGMIRERNIAISIILSIITCGIYGLYWLYTLADDANTVSNEQGTSAGLVVLFSILTCGIYHIYWNYKVGQKLYKAGQINNKHINDNSILYLILSLFGLSIINYCIIQSDLNQFS